MSRLDTLKLTNLQKGLWVLAGLAAMAFAALQLLPYSRPAASTAEDAGFRAIFELTDHTGMVRTQENFAGKWMLVFFGFTNCPDICPTTLSEVSAVMADLGPDAVSVQPLFISIDPDRDTPQVLSEYVPQFDAGIIGLTGTPEQIEQTSENFFIFYEKLTEASAPGGYTMGHASQLFLFGPDGTYQSNYPYGTPAEEIMADLTTRFRE